MSFLNVLSLLTVKSMDHGMDYILILIPVLLQAEVEAAKRQHKRRNTYSRDGGVRGSLWTI